MSMNDPHCEEFEQLRKLLALKRYEQPYPRYFNTFSQQVLARIQAGERGSERSSWLNRLWAALESKPVLAGSLGLAACVLLIGGFVSIDQDPVHVPQTPTIGLSQIAPSTPTTAQAPRSGLQAAPTLNASGMQGSLFQEIQEIQRTQQRPISEPVVFKFNN